MRSPICRSAALAFSLFSGSAIAAPEAKNDAKTEAKPDLAAIHRIKEEAFRSGKVMDHLFWISA